LFAYRNLRTTNMKKHNGMRPLDIVVLSKIIAYGHHEWKIRNLSNDLGISLSEISESLNRSMIGGLIDNEKRQVFRNNLLDFLQHGVKYVFPAVPGPLSIGTPTAHSAPFFQAQFISNEAFVWPNPDGNIRGQVIEPLYVSVANAVKNDLILYEILAAIDILRIGRPREIKLANQALKTLFDASVQSAY